MSRVTLTSSLIVAFGLFGMVFAADETAKKPSVWMRTKLENSQKVLGGLANGDFDAIARSAKAMNNLSELEKHVRSTTPGYRTQLLIFRAANADLIRQAERENLDGCALAFHQLTLSCVNCHKALREKQ
jgi:hypothetical protein